MGGTDRGFDPAARLAERDRKGLLRDLATVDAVGPRSSVEGVGDDALVFASNDYLGLAGDDRVAAAAAEAARSVGTGAGASRLVVGDTPAHRSLEAALADETDSERALAFSSGYAANVGTITALDPDVVFSDELNHASIIDGVRLSDADVEVYDHCDPGSLRDRLAARKETEADGDVGSWLVVTDSVFSMDGDVAPLPAICAAAEEYGAWVMVDEAHASGVYEGGIVGEYGLGDRIDVRLGTLSKALAAQGGYVAGDEALIRHLINAARSFVFSTGLAPAAAAAAERALEVAPGRRPALRENVERLRGGLESVGYEVRGGTHILPVMIGDRRDAVALEERLAERGIVAPAIRPPTVPAGTSRIRLAPTAGHGSEAIDRCLEAFEDAREVFDLP